jgi:hypothetical protein
MGFKVKSGRFRIILLFFIGVLVLILAIGGGYGENQFSPDSFENRGVSTYYIPQTNIEIFRWPGKPYREKIVQFWINEGYLAETIKRPNRWDTVSGWDPLTKQIYGGSAKAFWYRAGCKTDETAGEWITWSNQNPKLAAQLWPEVVSLVARGGYYYQLAARLMNLVDKTSDPMVFQVAFVSYRAEMETVKKELNLP